MGQRKDALDEGGGPDSSTGRGNGGIAWRIAQAESGISNTKMDEATELRFGW